MLDDVKQKLDALIFGVSRHIGGIIPDVTISEQIVDEVQVTTHPVDTGADVADHAYWKPSTIRCQFGWSDSSRLINSAMNGSLFRGLETTGDVYKRLLKMMKERQPFTLKTGKREFGSVIITRLELNTNAETENALVIDVSFRQIIIAVTKTKLVSKSYLNSPTNYGTQTATEVTR